MTPAQRLAREAVNGIEPPASFLASPTKIMFWRALAAGGRYNKHAAAVIFGWHLSSAHRAVEELHRAGKAHIVGWTRASAHGAMIKVIAFGPGKDAPRPPRQTNAMICKRWRNRHPEQARAIDRDYRLRQRIREGRLPVAKDELLTATLGSKS